MSAAAAPELMERVVLHAQRVEQRRKPAPDGSSRCRLEPRDPRVESARILDARAIWSGRQVG